jgi:hypothetical protein
MDVITTILRSIRDQLARVPWLRQAVPQMVGPWVDTVNPLAGWPGTIIEISGAGFSSVLDNNVVQVGGASALVLEGSASRLLVLAGRATTSGPVTVTVSGRTVTGSEPFTVLPYPAPDDLSSDGSPVFIDGPLQGRRVQGCRTSGSWLRSPHRPIILPGAGGAALQHCGEGVHNGWH